MHLISSRCRFPLSSFGMCGVEEEHVVIPPQGDQALRRCQHTCRWTDVIHSSQSVEVIIRHLTLTAPDELAVASHVTSVGG
ncbi:unnamed protein product [Boreogadus saida]